jgi:hypothetical protein
MAVASFCKLKSPPAYNGWRIWFGIEETESDNFRTFTHSPPFCGLVHGFVPIS